MENIIIVFGLGMLWIFLTGIQSKLFVNTKYEWVLPVWSFITSVIWYFLIKKLLVGDNTVIPYAFGTAIGAFLVRKIGKFLVKNQ